MWRKTWCQYDATTWTCFAKQNKMNKVYCKNFGCHRSKHRLLTVHHWILSENWSTETINYFGLKVIYHQGQLILRRNGKNMVVSAVCYCCCFLIASFCCIFWHDLCINRCLDDYRNQHVLCLIGSLCSLEMTEESEECGDMFSGVDDGEWDINDDNEDDLRKQ